MRLSVTGYIYFSCQIEGGCLKESGAVVYAGIEFFVPKIMIPSINGFWFFGVRCGVNEKHIGLGLVLVVHISFGTLICLIVDEWQGAPMIGIAIIWCWRCWRLIESCGNEIVLRRKRYWVKQSIQRNQQQR